MKEFVEHRLIKRGIKFHDSLKQQNLKTFETLYSVPVSLEKGKSVAVKANRDLLRRVIVALESGREVDVDAIMQRELLPIPLSIATLDGTLRQAKAKSNLSSIMKIKKMRVRASPLSTRIKRAPLLMEWRCAISRQCFWSFWRMV